MENGVSIGGRDVATGVTDATDAMASLNTRKNITTRKNTPLKPLKTMKNITNKTSAASNQNPPNPETISVAAGKHLEELYSGLGSIVKNIFTK